MSCQITKFGKNQVFVPLERQYVLIRVKIGMVQHTMGPLYHAKFSHDRGGSPNFENVIKIMF